MEAVRNRPIADGLRIQRDPLTLLLEGMRTKGAAVRYRFGPFNAVLTKRSEDVEHVLVKNQKNYIKGRNYEPLKLTLGEGLVTSEGALWKRQRKLIQPAFHHKSLATFVETMTSATEDLLARWSGETESVDVHEAMMRLTFRIVGLTLLSTDVEDAADRIGPALTYLLDFTDRRSAQLVRLPLWVPLPSHLRFKRQRRIFDDLVYDIIRTRRRSQEQKHDLLGMLLAASEESMPEKQLRDELITLVSAGHETTANALSWTFYLLSKYPDVERRIFEEVQAVLGDRTPTLQDLSRLSLTERVIEESMRLYPPVWGIEREAVGEDVVGGQRVRPGDMVMVIPYSIHRDPLYWPNPEGFDPDRFLPEEKEKRPRFAYLPFGGGPRVCIGNAFAMMEAKVIVAMIVRHSRLHLVPGHPVIEEPSITLRPKRGIRVTLEHRV